MNTRKILAPVAAASLLFALVASTEETGGDSASSGGQSGGSSSGGSGAAGDVSISSCGTDSLGQLEAVLSVTNNSSKSSDYMIEVVFESADGSTQLDSSIAFVSNLAPGQKASTEAISFTDAPAGDFKCRVTDVTRTASL